MYRIIYRNVAIIALALFGVIVFYKEPDWVVELLYPDHFSDHSKPNDSMVFSLFLLGVIAGVIGILVQIGSPPRR